MAKDDKQAPQVQAQPAKREKPRRIRKFAKTFINFPRWMGVDELKVTGNRIGRMVKDLVTPAKAQHHETFEEAVERLGLTEKDIQERMKSFRLQSRVIAFVALVLLGYAIYLFVSDHILAGFIAVLITGVAVTLAVKEHFRYFQMKQRQLGSTLGQWFKAFIGRG